MASIYMRNRLRDMHGPNAREPKSYEVDRMEREIMTPPVTAKVTVQEITDAFNSGEEVRKSSSFCSAHNETC